jgi:hypothetical protein
MDWINYSLTEKNIKDLNAKTKTIIHKKWYISSFTKEKKIISISKNLKRKIELIHF